MWPGRTRGGWGLAVVVVAALVLASGVAAESAAGPKRFAEFKTALDEIVARARPEGGWTFEPGPRGHGQPHTAPLRFAERIAAPFGLADWDIVVLRSPGTPTAILALLNGYRWTHVDRYRATAVRAGDLLIAIQMGTGGWFSEMPVHGAAPVWWFTWGVQRTTIDDDVTPGATRALLALYEVTREPRFRVAAERSIAFLLAWQLPDGAWPLIARPRWKQAVYRDFEDRPTLNDGATTQAILTLLMAARVLERPDLVAAARRAGDWIVRAQHVAPQAGWAQQYDDAGAPTTARRYERIALASWETRYAIDALIALADATGDVAYCAPVVPAARWLIASQITPGCWARFYELGSNHPLYINERRQAVASPADAHHPYDWTGDYGIPNLLQRLGGGCMGDELTERVPGDPGACPAASASAVAPFDPGTATDPRQVIAWAGRVGGAIDPLPPAPPACRLSSER